MFDFKFLDLSNSICWQSSKNSKLIFNRTDKLRFELNTETHYWNWSRCISWVKLAEQNQIITKRKNKWLSIWIYSINFSFLFRLILHNLGPIFRYLRIILDFGMILIYYNILNVIQEIIRTKNNWRQYKFEYEYKSIFFFD